MPETQLIFEGTAGSGWFWFSLAVCVGAGWLIVLLMRYERRLVSRRVGMLLLLLRLSVLGVLLLTFLQPTMTHVVDQEHRSRVLVAIDVSESMNTSDTHASRANLLRWGRAAGIIGNDNVSSRLDRWIDAWESGTDPVWVDESEATTPERRQELATLRQKHVDEILDLVRGLPRRELVRRVLASSRNTFLRELQDAADVEWQLFAGSSETIVADAVDALLSDVPESVVPSATDLAGCLRSGQRTAASKLAGVILLTDGRHTGDTDPVEAAHQAGLAEVPVIPVIFGSDQRPKDISIHSLEYPRLVFLEDSLTIRVDVQADGYAGEELKIHLKHPDGEEESRSVTVPVDGRSVLDVRFSLAATTPGRQEFQIRTDHRPDETRGDNNQRSISVNVIDDHSSVLIVDSEPRWEFRFLQTALSRDDRISVTPVLFNQPYLGALPDTFFPRRLPFDPQQVDLRQSPLDRTDLIVIGDIAPDNIHPAFWGVIEHWVRDLGGTLVLSAGRRFMPRQHRSPELSRLLPLSQIREVTVDRIATADSPEETGFHLSLTDDGAEHDALKLDPDPLTNRRLWQSLPGHFRGLIGTAHPAATVLVRATGIPVRPSPAGGSATDLQQEREAGILIHQYYGFGQVLWLGIDSTWRWRHRRGDELHHRFWGQIVRWATRNKSAAGNDTVRLSLSTTEAESGEPVTIRAHWQQRFLDQHPGLKARVEFVRSEDSTPATGSPSAVHQSELLPLDRQPMVFEGRAPQLPPGNWTVRLRAAGVDPGAPVETSLHIAPPRTAELADLTANRNLLTSMAAASAGGQLLTPDRLHEALPLLNLSDDESDRRQEFSLWDHWSVMLAFFTLLTAEWILRKLNGLP